MGDHRSAKTAQIKYDNAAGTLTNITDDIATFTITINGQVVDLSTIGDAWADQDVGSKNWQIQLSGMQNDTTPTTETILFGAVGTSVSRTVAIQNHTGAPWFTGETFGSQHSLSGGHNAAAAFDFTAVGNGTLTKTSVEPS